MDEGFPFDILLFAMVAAFIVLRLRGVLGRRTGHERPPQDLFQRFKRAPEENVIPLPDANGGEEAGETERLADSPAAAGLARIRKADHRFDVDGFLAGARAAYEMIIGAFAAGDTKALRPFVNNEVYDNFAGAIDQRQEHHLDLASTLVSIKSADITAASMKGSEAEITVEFVSEIVKVLRDASGAVIEGDPTAVREVIDIWTFRHDTHSSDPNWTLVETRGGD